MFAYLGAWHTVGTQYIHKQSWWHMKQKVGTGLPQAMSRQQSHPFDDLQMSGKPAEATAQLIHIMIALSFLIPDSLDA